MSADTALDLAKTERYVRMAVRNGLHSTPPEFLALIMAEYDRREERFHRLLDECDRREQYVRDNVPYLPPDAASLSVHVIRLLLGVTE